jgi:hypothetical protein
MAKSKKAAPQLKVPAEPITEFEVTEGGTLRMANYVEAESRAEFYEDVADRWEGSPQDLSDAMDECQPLAWAVNSIYSDFRDEIVAEIGAAETDAKQNKRLIAALKARLNKLPEEPEEGASGWLLRLTTSEFEANVVPQVQEWFSEPPDWNFEDDYLPQTGTAQGAALEFFRSMDANSVDSLGVYIVESEHPGSTYYAAELRGDIEAANTTAISCGLAVRFVRHSQAMERTQGTASKVSAVGQKSSSSGRAPTDSIQIYGTILSKSPGHGSFSERHTLPSGEEVIHRCSQATGLAALHFSNKYRAQFGEPPSWLAVCHPTHRRQLSEWALENQVPLPDELPQP